MKLSLWASGPPIGRAEDEFNHAKVRRVQDGREYARLTTGPLNQAKALDNIAQMLKWEGWADVQVLEGA